ncbi:hypothetical protein ACTFIW_010310, partial [Dictyostelium discoideum]
GGVHALQQVAHFRTNHTIDTIRVMRSLNGMLPLDIRISSLISAPIHFHARKSATAKEYHYTIITGPLVLPQDRRYAWHIFQALDIAKIEQANENTKGAAAKNNGSKYYWNARSYWIGDKTVEEIENTFYQRDRRSVDRSAPAHGLKLARIEYSRESASSMIDRSPGFQIES